MSGRRPNCCPIAFRLISWIHCPLWSVFIHRLRKLITAVEGHYRLFGPERIPGPPAGGERRRAPPGEAAGALSCAGPPHRPGTAADRLDACARRDSRAEPARTRGGNPPGRAERGGPGRAPLAPSHPPAGVVRPL